MRVLLKILGRTSDYLRWRPTKYPVNKVRIVQWGFLLIFIQLTWTMKRNLAVLWMLICRKLNLTLAQYFEEISEACLAAPIWVPSKVNTNFLFYFMLGLKKSHERGHNSFCMARSWPDVKAAQCYTQKSLMQSHLLLYVWDFFFTVPKAGQEKYVRKKNYRNTYKWRRKR